MIRGFNYIILSVGFFIHLYFKLFIFRTLVLSEFIKKIGMSIMFAKDLWSLYTWTANIPLLKCLANNKETM